MLSSKSYLTFLLSLSVSTLIAQNAVLFPHLSEVQQVLQRNPAQPFDAKVSVALGSAFVGYQNNLFKYGDIDQDLPILSQLEAIVDNHTRTEKINLAARADVFGLSVLTEVGRFSIGVSQRADVKTSIPEEFTNYIFRGDDYLANRSLMVDDFKAEASSFVEVALRYQTPERNDGLSFGGSLKILGGQGHGVLSDAFGQTISSSTTDTFFVEARGRVRSSGVASFGADTMLSVSTLLRQPNNMGLGLDMGIYYQLDDTWSFGVSLLDIGFMRWKRRIYDAEFGARFRSVGVPSLVSATADLETFANSIDDLIIDEPFTGTSFPDEYGRAYTRMLMPSLLGTASARVNDAFEAGASYGYDFDPNGGQHRIGVNGKVNAGEYIQALAGYSFAGPKHSGLGVGLVLALGPLQVYATADNVLELIDQDQLNGVAVNAGANLIFPMVWFDTSSGSRKGRKRGKAVECYEF